MAIIFTDLCGNELKTRKIEKERKFEED